MAASAVLLSVYISQLGPDSWKKLHTVNLSHWQHKLLNYSVLFRYFLCRIKCFLFLIYLSRFVHSRDQQELKSNKHSQKLKLAEYSVYLFLSHFHFLMVLNWASIESNLWVLQYKYKIYFTWPSMRLYDFLFSLLSSPLIIHPPGLTLILHLQKVLHSFGSSGRVLEYYDWIIYTSLFISVVRRSWMLVVSSPSPSSSFPLTCYA